MKKILTLSLMLISLGLFGGTRASAMAPAPQVRVEIGQRHRHDDWRWRNRYRNRVWTETRVVHRGWRTYRETYQVRYMPDGRTETVVLSRVRLS